MTSFEPLFPSPAEWIGTTQPPRTFGLITSAALHEASVVGSYRSNGGSLSSTPPSR